MQLSITEAEEETTCTAPAIMLFNNGYAVTIMNCGSMSSRDETLLPLQVTMQQPTVSNHYPLELEASNTTNAYQHNMVELTSTLIHSAVLPSTAGQSLYYYFSSAFEVAS